MSRFTTISSEGNGKRRTTNKAAALEKTARALVHEAFGGLPSSGTKGPGDIKIEVKIERHEHKYFITPESAEERQYTTLSTLVKHRDPGEVPDENTRKWKQELERFEHLKSQLWKDPKLRHRFVALCDGKVVDHDLDKFALARRIRRSFPKQVVLITRVQRGTRVVDMPSPELDG